MYPGSPWPPVFNRLVSSCENHCLQEPLVRKVEPLGSGTFIGPEKKRGKGWKRGERLLMAEILHQLIGSLSHYLQGFKHPRWCRISSINRMFVSLFFFSISLGFEVVFSPGLSAFTGGSLLIFVQQRRMRCILR